MNKTAIISEATRNLNRAIFQCKKHSPEILAITGTLGIVASGVMACKATLKVNDILEESKETVELIRKTSEDENLADKYTKEDSKKDLAIVYTQTSVKLVKLYGPSVVLGVASLGCLLGSNNILRKRNIALAAAYTTIDKSFKDYRGRVVERFGEAIDKELRYNIKAEEIEETVVDEKGKEKKVKKTVEVIDPNTISDYSRIFYEGNPGWTKDPEMNLVYLKQQQNWANDKLKAKGFLFLNEVYDMLGFPRTKAGQIVGWVYDEKNPIGDNFVDFGIYNLDNPANIRFVNGDERSILLDFNVDGNIWDLM